MKDFSNFRTGANKSGFTLAEVLVTLGIIGVVSAMTVPTLMQSHQRKTYVTQLHKVYNEFQQATTEQITERHAMNLTESGVRSTANLATFIQEHFRTVKQSTNHLDCMGNETGNNFTNMNGSAATISGNDWQCYVLASGSAICGRYQVSVASRPGENGAIELNANHIPDLIGDLIIDVNGKQGPNVVGRDVFIAGIYKDGSLNSANPKLLEVPRPGESVPTNLSKCQSATSIARQTDAAYCFHELLQNNWEMDY